MEVKKWLTIPNFDSNWRLATSDMKYGAANSSDESQRITN